LELPYLRAKALKVALEAIYKGKPVTRTRWLKRELPQSQDVTRRFARFEQLFGAPGTAKLEDSHDVLEYLSANLDDGLRRLLDEEFDPSVDLSEELEALLDDERTGLLDFYECQLRLGPHDPDKVARDEFMTRLVAGLDIQRDVELVQEAIEHDEFARSLRLLESMIPKDSFLYAVDSAISAAEEREGGDRLIVSIVAIMPHERFVEYTKRNSWNRENRLARYGNKCTTTAEIRYIRDDIARSFIGIASGSTPEFITPLVLGALGLR